ncbi:MAG TPA: helix-turn-helix transcriptional regulator [Thermomicrobiales bacterium]|nr:helix-turn-helix transcriptional regulator [Thermomicrobiales bacterium]
MAAKLDDGSPEAAYRTAAGAVFHRLRSERNWSFRDFGERVGVAHTSLYAVERRETTPTIDTLAAVAAACELTLPAVLTLIIDEMTAAGDSTAAAVLQATAALNDDQRAEVLRFVEWVRFRDG